MEIHINLDVIDNVDKLKEAIDKLRPLASLEDKLIIDVTIQKENGHNCSTNQLENQSFYGASTNHPYEVQLPVKDLVDLYVARDARLHRSSNDHEK